MSVVKRLDFWIAIAFAVMGGILGAKAVLLSGRVAFYQNFTPEVVYLACSHGFQRSAALPPALLDFLLLKTTVFDCDALGSKPALVPPGWFAQVQGYLTWTVAMLWRVTSVSYANLWPLAALFHGLYAAGCYVLLRQFNSRLASVPGGVILAASPLAFQMLIAFRDYSKAPFFIWALVFLIQLLRARGMREMSIWAAAAGATIGAGYGFRTDIMILAPLFILTILVSFQLRLLLRRAIAGIILLAAVVLTALPVLSVDKDGTYGSVIIQGMSDPYRQFLQMEPALYSFGDRYSDELVLSSIAADERPRHPDWDSHEGPALYDVSQALKLSGQYWQGILPMFPADFVAQAFKSAGWIAGMPALIAARHPPDPAFPYLRSNRWAAFYNQTYTHLASPILPYLGIAGLLVLFWRIWSRSRQEATALGFLFIALVTYPVVQFSIRHVFHLEFVWILAVLSLAAAPFEIKQLRQGAIGYLSLVGLSALAGLFGYQALAVMQRHALTEAFNGLLAGPASPIGQASGNGGPVEVAVPVPPGYAALIASAPDSMTPAIRTAGVQWNVRSAADRLLVRFEGEACSPRIDVSTVYTKKPEVWQPLDQTYRVPQDAAMNGSVMLLPAFYRPTQYLASIRIDGLSPGCRARVDRFDGETEFPALLSATLQPDWVQKGLLAGFGGFWF